MKATLLLASILATVAPGVLATPVDKRSCSSNNCLRAVRAGNFPTRANTIDCSSFLGLLTLYSTISSTSVTTTQVTSTAIATSIQTTTTLTTETDTVAGTSTTVSTSTSTVLYRRNPAPTIPAYASKCVDAAAYSSACSCIGVFPALTTIVGSTTVGRTATSSVTSSTTTVTTTTQTQTSTTSIDIVVSTTTTGVMPSHTATLFQLQASSSGAHNGYWVWDYDGDFSLGYTNARSYAYNFTLNSASNLIDSASQGLVYVDPSNNNMLRIASQSAVTANPGNYDLITCSFSGYNSLSCNFGTLNVFGFQGLVIYLFQSPQENYETLTLNAFPEN